MMNYCKIKLFQQTFPNKKWSRQFTLSQYGIKKGQELSQFQQYKNHRSSSGEKLHLEVENYKYGTLNLKKLKKKENGFPFFSEYGNLTYLRCQSYKIYNYF